MTKERKEMNCARIQETASFYNRSSHFQVFAAFPPLQLLQQWDPADIQVFLDCCRVSMRRDKHITGVVVPGNGMQGDVILM